MNMPKALFGPTSSILEEYQNIVVFFSGKDHSKLDYFFFPLRVHQLTFVEWIYQSEICLLLLHCEKRNISIKIFLLFIVSVQYPLLV